MNKESVSGNGKFYNKFLKTKKTVHHESYRTEKQKIHSKERTTVASPAAAHQNSPDAVLMRSEPLFSALMLPDNSRAVLEHFDTIVQNVRPLNSRQLLHLPDDIRILSHELTDERTTRRLGYMNDAASLSAYTRYFTWWNLVRLTRLFVNLDKSSFALADDSVCLDIGSGPLTVVIALWLARPELRAKKLTWYCMDLSQGALALGEDLYLSIAARTPAVDLQDENVIPHWNIIRVKGPLGTEIKRKADFITCANMFNELCQNTSDTPEFLAKKYSNSLTGYAGETARILIVEPGVPKAARFTSLLRDTFIRKNMNIASPCPHTGECPMNGMHAHKGGTAKWCNFAFTTENAPKALLKLSEQSALPKERAVLSFIFAVSHKEITRKTTGGRPLLTLRIASDPIRLGYRTGFYACCTLGLTLVINESGTDIQSGDLITVQPLHNLDNLTVDVKSGAKELVIRK
jgi:hypothetical protein